MRKAISVMVAAVLFVVVEARASVTEVVDNYYTDATFSTSCGWFDNNCLGPVHSEYWESWGCRTNYRYHETYDCMTGQQLSGACQEWNGTQWVSVACSDETVTAQMRIHIPVG